MKTIVIRRLVGEKHEMLALGHREKISTLLCLEIQ